MGCLLQIIRERASKRVNNEQAFNLRRENSEEDGRIFPQMGAVVRLGELILLSDRVQIVKNVK